MSQKIFVDSDVVVSPLLSQSGAASLLLNTFSLPTNLRLQFFISNISTKEIMVVIKRLNLDKSKFDVLVENNLETIKLKDSAGKLKIKYKAYVNDLNDAHIVAGAVDAKARFLVSYNLKDFKIEKIDKDFKIRVITPANLVQYLRSQA